MKKVRSAPGKQASLKASITQKIVKISSVEQDIPGAIIIHNLKDSTVAYMNTWGLKYLGVTLEQLHKMGTEYHNYFFNPEDAKDYVPKILGLLERNNDDEFVCFFQQVRKSPKHEWVWYLSSTRIFFRDALGAPLLTLTTSLPVDTQHHIANKAQKMINENNFLRTNTHIFNALTRREKEILKLMALGLSSAQMAKKLHISGMTAATHRRNIKNKLKAQNNYDITKFAQAFDLI